MTEPPEPTIQQFGLTEEQVAWATRSLEQPDKMLSFVLPFALSVLGSALTFVEVGLSSKPKIVLVWVFAAWFLPLTKLGEWINRKLTAKREHARAAHPMYRRYLEFQRAKVAHTREQQLRVLAEARRREAEIAAEQARLRQQEAWWRQLDGYDFELELAQLLRQRGYEVKQTGRSGDGGVDLVVIHQGKRILVQCKAHKSRIGPGTVRDLYGTLVHNRADEAWLVATSAFCSGAVQFARNKPIKLLTIHQILRGWVARGNAGS